MPEFIQGQEVWYLPEGYPLLIKCTIRSVDDEFRKKDSRAYLFYDLDEPVGHNVGEDEIFLTKEAAIEWMVDFWKKYPDEDHENFAPVDDFPYDENSLKLYRRKKLTFIVSTWGHKTQEEKDFIIEEMLNKDYPKKEYQKDWFFIEDLA